MRRGGGSLGGSLEKPLLFGRRMEPEICLADVVTKMKTVSGQLVQSIESDTKEDWINNIRQLESSNCVIGGGPLEVPVYGNKIS